jgi:hypothetical protein
MRGPGVRKRTSCPALGVSTFGEQKEDLVGQAVRQDPDLTDFACQPALDQGQSSAEPTSPVDTGLSSM